MAATNATIRSTLDPSLFALLALALAPGCKGAPASAVTVASAEGVASGSSGASEAAAPRPERSLPANAGSIACAFQDAVSGSPLGVAAQVRVSAAGALVDEVTSEEGACSVPVAPGVYDVTAVIPEYDYEMRFPNVRVCAGGATPLQLALDLERSRGKKSTADFDVPCEGF